MKVRLLPGLPFYASRIISHRVVRWILVLDDKISPVQGTKVSNWEGGQASLMAPPSPKISWG